jgi:hypothetical protein
VGTETVFGGNIDNDVRQGGRFRAGLWLDDCHSLGVETTFFFLAERTIGFTAGSDFAPVVARPFLNVRTGAEDAQLVASSMLHGRVDVSSSSRLWGIDPDLVESLYRDCNCTVDLLAGFRYARLDEGLLIGEDLDVPGNAQRLAGTNFRIADDFATRNSFYGAQVGARARYHWDKWSVEALGKLALGVSHESVSINGATRIAQPGEPVQHDTGGLLALPTNIGNYHHDAFAVLPEVGVTLGYQVTSCLRATVGYSFLYWSNVARPGSEIDRVINTSQLPPGALQGPRRPEFDFKETGFWAQGVNFGLELDF